jgi:S-DNA-T family DNA segregation ATPase FtsK/SpoIIIE
MIETVDSLNRVLNSFKIKAECVGLNQHRHFAHYDLKLSPGCKVNKLTQHAKEIALALKCKNVPIIKLIPEEGIVRLQVTYGVSDTLLLETLLARGEAPPGTLQFCLGETDEGETFWVDMATNPHMLVAGTTGSGKSIFLHNLIANARNTLNTRLFLIDTKKVEFGAYDSPKYTGLIVNVAKDYTDACSLLEHLCSVMEARYAYLDSLGLTNITECPFLMDKIMVIIDEVADLILLDRNEKFQTALVKLAAKSRAAGIYIVLATQRPSVDIITGAIKANFPARMAFKVSSRTDSQIILDTPGAENLSGKGEAIFKNPNYDLVRLQVGYVTSADVIKKL